MLFEQKHYKKPISEQLSDYIRKHTDRDDRANVSLNTGVGTSTIRDVIYRHNALTEKNAVAIIELMKIAIHNCTVSINEASRDKQALESLLNE